MKSEDQIWSSWNLWHTFESEHLHLTGEKNTFSDLNRDIFCCMSLRKPFILWAKANDGLEVEEEFDEAVGGLKGTWKNKIEYC